MNKLGILSLTIVANILIVFSITKYWSILSLDSFQSTATYFKDYDINFLHILSFMNSEEHTRDILPSSLNSGYATNVKLGYTNSLTASHQGVADKYTRRLAESSSAKVIHVTPYQAIQLDRHHMRKDQLVYSSPDEGTDILSNPTQIIGIYNQSRAVTPKLQLRRDFKVYFCKHKENGVRFFFLSREGLLLHPRIRLVQNPENADFIVYLPVSAGWHETECNKPSYRNKTIIMDEGDGPGLFEVDGDSKAASWFLYFKRSFVSRHKGVFKGYMGYVNFGTVFPMTYPTGEAYLRLQYNQFINRDIDVLCTLRGSNHDPVRLRIREWVEEYIRARGIKNAKAGQLNHDSRRTISKQYFESMYRSKIIVTSNPSGWEGDFRFCEALSSGALIFIDQMYVPRPYPFEHGKHIIQYDNMNKTDLFEKLDYYRAQSNIAAKVAMQGYLHAMKYHRAVSLIDYVFRTAHFKLLRTVGESQVAGNLRGVYHKELAHYTDTGYDILKIAQTNARNWSLHNHN